MYWYRLTMIGFFMSLMNLQTLAAGSDDPSWPCVQRKVDLISIGQVWPNATESEVVLDDQAKSLAKILTQRRLTEDEARAYISEYTQNHEGATRDEYGAIVSLMLDDINRQRQRIISGIGRYAQGQQDKAKRIDDIRVEMAEEETKEPVDFDKIDLLEEELDWEERIYRDRERSLSFVCETPVILEKHAFAMAKIMDEFTK